MSGSILTPVAIWGAFRIEQTPTFTVIDERVEGSVTVTRGFVDGRKIKDQQVKVLVTITKSVKNTTMPAILMVEDFAVGYDEKLAIDLAMRGYVVVSVDLYGKRDGSEYYTQYPEIIDYANYENVKDQLYTVSKDAVHTCWYEWCCAIRYVLAYLKTQDKISSIGVLGISESATALWHATGFDKSISCAVFAMNSGWIGYRGIYKFGGQVEPQFSDDTYKFLAGVDPQAYATHVKCPVLILSATNDNDFDCDRAMDIVSRLDKEVYTAVHYSVGYVDRVSGKAYNDAILFFEEYLKKGGKGDLPNEPEIKVEMVDGKMMINVVPDRNGLKGVAVYVSEQITDPAKRSWKKLIVPKSKSEEGYIFEHKPYFESTLVTAFAKAEYKKGFEIGSSIVCRKFKAEDVFKGYKSNVIYSSRVEGGESVFSASHQDKEDKIKINYLDKRLVEVLKGPMDIYGAYSKWGLLTFKINAVKDKPNESAILMFDCYTKENNQVTVKLITDYFGNKTEYKAKVNLLGGAIWHNVKLEKSKFKTEEGMTLKSYEKVTAIEFNAQGEWLMNNALWV